MRGHNDDEMTVAHCHVLDSAAWWSALALVVESRSKSRLPGRTKPP